MLSTPSHPPRRPRPPGSRRPASQGRLSLSVDSLPTKTPLGATTTSTATAVKTPVKSSVKTPSSATKKKGKGKAPIAVATTVAVDAVPEEPDTSVQDASFQSSPGLARARPMSMMSETSIAAAASPPPPYRHVPGSSPERLDEKTQLPEMSEMVKFPPPPPEPLESGPSSVRTSFVEEKYDHETSDDDESAPGNTLTLRGLRRLLKEREREEAMTQEVSARLVPYENLHSSLPNALDMRANPSPTSTVESPLGIRFAPFQYRSTSSDPAITFSLSKPRWRKTSARDYERQLAYLHAQEEEERIAALEDALAEARDSEEAQRKANARLRRDNSKLRRQLEQAEDAVAEHLEQEALRSTPSSTTSSPYASLRRRMHSHTESESERVGWGTNTFPEFPRDPDWRINLKALEVLSEATSESTQRPPQSSGDNTPRLPAEPTMAEPLSASLSDGKKSPVTPPSESVSTTTSTIEQTVILPPADRGRVRPTVSSETFISPPKSKSPPADGSRPVTPRLTIDAGSNPGSAKSSGSRPRRSPYPSPHPSPRHQRSDSSSSNGNGAGPHRRGPSFSSSKSLRMILNNATKEAITPLQGTPATASAKHVSPATALAARMDSVRSYVSDYLGRRTLGSELGSNYSPSPLGFPSPEKDHCTCEEGKECPCEHVETVEFEDIANLTMQLPRRTPPSAATPQRPREVSPTATFVLRGSLASSASTSNAYEALYEGNVKHIRWAPAPDAKKVVTNWSPHSWPSPSQPSPSPSPRNTSLPMPAEDDEADEQAHHVEAVRGDGSHGSHGTLLAAFAGSTPGSRIQGPVANSPSPVPHLLAPSADPWDEYSDRATPSPRTRVLRPLLLCSKPAVTARTYNLAYVHRRSASAASGLPPVRHRFASGNGVPHPAIMAHRRNVSLTTANPHLPRVPAGPVTIPGRIMHDIFCLILVVLDYIEWGIILVYRLLVDIRAGPDAAITRRRTHAQRYYV